VVSVFRGKQKGCSQLSPLFFMAHLSSSSVEISRFSVLGIADLKNHQHFKGYTQWNLIIQIKPSLNAFKNFKQNWPVTYMNPWNPGLMKKTGSSWIIQRTFELWICFQATNGALSDLNWNNRGEHRLRSSQEKSENGSKCSKTSLVAVYWYTFLKVCLLMMNPFGFVGDMNVLRCLR